MLMFFGTAAFCQAKASKVVKAGKGNPVLFLPGFTKPGSVWNETISYLSAKKETHISSYAGFNGIAAIDTPWYAIIKGQLLQYIVKENLRTGPLSCIVWVVPSHWILLQPFLAK